jgi:hypothetical protein
MSALLPEIQKKKLESRSFGRNLRVGWFLAKRDIKRANIWTTTLIVSVMVFTFLNLVVVAGILVGLIEGSENSAKEYGTGNRGQKFKRVLCKRHIVVKG